jgi:hypothetical protein
MEVAALVNDPPPGRPAGRQLLDALTLPCGAEVDLLLEQAADGRAADRTAHQRQCVHCQAALGEFTALWAPATDLAATPVAAPPGLAAAAMRQIRSLVRGLPYTLQLTGTGAIRIAAQVLAALARTSAQTVPASGSPWVLPW